MPHLLITGGAGFIGSNFAKTSINRGWKVRILDDLSTGLQSIADELELKGVQIFTGDIRDESLLDRAI